MLRLTGKLLCTLLLCVLPLCATQPHLLLDSTDLSSIRAKAPANSADWVTLKATMGAILVRGVARIRRAIRSGVSPRRPGGGHRGPADGAQYSCRPSRERGYFAGDSGEVRREGQAIQATLDWEGYGLRCPISQHI